MLCELACMFWFVYWPSAVAFGCFGAPFLVRQSTIRAPTGRFFLLSEHRHLFRVAFTWRAAALLSTLFVFCLFVCFSAERSSISLKNVTNAGKNGTINEAFEMEVCTWIDASEKVLFLCFNECLYFLRKMLPITVASKMRLERLKRDWAHTWGAERWFTLSIRTSGH